MADGTLKVNVRGNDGLFHEEVVKFPEGSWILGPLPDAVITPVQ